MIQRNSSQHRAYSSIDEAPAQRQESSERSTEVDIGENDETESEKTTRQGPTGENPDKNIEPEEAGYELPLDQIFEILKNSRRRRVLRYLQENGDETTLSEVAEHIAALENDTTVRAISSAQRKRVYVGLYQCHLPKMDDTDVVDFDQNRGTIETGPNASQLEPYLDEPDERDWHKLYLGTTLGGVGLFATSMAGAAAVGLTPTVVLILTLTGISGVVAAQFTAER